MTEIKKTWEIISGKPPDILKPPFIALVVENKTEFIPLILCKDCMFKNNCEIHIGSYDPNWFCADGKPKVKEL